MYKLFRHLFKGNTIGVPSNSFYLNRIQILYLFSRIGKKRNEDTKRTYISVNSRLIENFHGFPSAVGYRHVSVIDPEALTYISRSAAARIYFPTE